MTPLELTQIIEYSKSKMRKFAFCQIGASDFENLCNQLSEWPLKSQTYIAQSNIKDKNEKMVVFKGFTTFFKLQ